MKIFAKILRKLLWYYYIKTAIKEKNGSTYIAKNAFVSRKSILYVDGNFLEIGDNTYIHEYVYIRLYGGYIKIGKNCSINPFCVLYGHGGLTIGDNVRIAAHCTIIPSNHIFDRIDIPIFEQGETMIGIKIEDDVWLGTGVKVLDGVIIGKGSVIGAGSVVTRSIPPYSVAVGIPAKVIKKRGI